MPTAPILVVDQLRKTYTRGWPRRVTFTLEADFAVKEPATIGVMGPNGSGKTTLFELITGSNRPTHGTVRCLDRDVHRVKASERDRLAIHYHQSYQVRHFRWRRPDVLLQPAGSDYPVVHLFDEPQFNTQDGYIGFMLEFFRKLRGEGRVVFICLHPTERFHLNILQEVCERYIFVDQGRLAHMPDYPSLLADPRVRDYLGHLADSRA